MTRERRFLVSRLGAQPETRIEGSEAHHLLHVLRLRPGDDLVVFDGEGSAYRARLLRRDGESAFARLLEPLPSSESPLELTLAVAIPKRGGLSRFLQSLTEMGTSHLIPLLTGRTQLRSPQPALGQMRRWRRIAAEACKVSGRSRIPLIEDPISLDELLDRELPAERLILSPTGGPLPRHPGAPACVALVGPEGGWTPAEEEAARATGFQPLSLGPRTLRTVTAAMAIAAVLQWTWGDLHR